MIVIKLQGGLGNQMFQYATARRLAHSRNTDLYLDITAYNNMPDTDTPRHYELDSFVLDSKIIDPTKLNVIKQEVSRLPNIKATIKNLSKKKLFEYSNTSQEFDQDVLILKDNSYLVGWFQNEKYFEDIREVLLKDFEFKDNASEESSRIIEKLHKEESVSLHVRRGDYITNANANKFHGVTNLGYYKSAIDRICKDISNPVFYIFSDDIEWCKKELRILQKTVFVTHNSKGSEDLRIMRECKHNIVANSSFSWWGAWLNTNNKKIVIAPRIWFADTEQQSQTDIIPKSWLKL